MNPVQFDEEGRWPSTQPFPETTAQLADLSKLERDTVQFLANMQNFANGHRMVLLDNFEKTLKRKMAEEPKVQDESVEETDKGVEKKRTKRKKKEGENGKESK